MLILGRRERETVVIETSDGPIRVTIVRAGKSTVRVGIDAPEQCHIVRDELLEAA